MCLIFILQNRFENYYGGPYLEFGHLLYTKLFGGVVPVEEEMFVSAMTVLERLSNRQEEHLAAERFYFSVFTEGKETIDRQRECCRGGEKEVKSLLPSC